MDRWEELIREEQKLLEKEDCLSQDRKQAERIKEAYNSHLREARLFMENNCYLFQKNDKRHTNLSDNGTFGRKYSGNSD